MNGTPTTVPGALGMRDVRVLMAIYEAARTGRTDQARLSAEAPRTG